MHYFTNTAFLRALGYAITQSFWQVALCWVSYTVINAFFSFSAASKYRLAYLFQVAGFCWFLSNILGHLMNEANTIDLQTTYFPSHISFKNIPPLYDIGYSLLGWADTMLPFISMAYLLLISFFLIRFLIGYRHTQQIRAAGLQDISEHWIRFIKKLLSLFKFRRLK